jgi:hypothetical protein
MKMTGDDKNIPQGQASQLLHLTSLFVRHVPINLLL